MKKLTLITIILAVMLPVMIWAQCADCPSNTSKKVSTVKVEKPKLAGYNKANWIDGSHYYTYSFVKKPKLGASILKVNVFDKSKKPNKDYTVYVTADMPSMRGMHASGDVQMKANKKGDLLAPLNFVMPGVWEVELKFMKAGKQVSGGVFELKI